MRVRIKNKKHKRNDGYLICECGSIRDFLIKSMNHKTVEFKCSKCNRVLNKINRSKIIEIEGM